jgi:hypothetical protein
MFYILIKPGEEPVYPYTLTDLMRANPGTSFPRDMTGFDASDWYCYPVQDTTPPEATGMVAQRIAPELVDGVWQERWGLVEPTPEQAEAQADAVRYERNAKLTASDWTQIADAPLSDTQKLAWAGYRQSLRDVPSQPGFPWSVVWPTKPE